MPDAAVSVSQDRRLGVTLFQRRTVGAAYHVPMMQGLHQSGNGEEKDKEVYVLLKIEVAKRRKIP